MISAVIDTNVLVSAFWSFGKDTPPMRILRALVNGEQLQIVESAGQSTCAFYVMRA